MVGSKLQVPLETKANGRHLDTCIGSTTGPDEDIRSHTFLTSARAGGLDNVRWREIYHRLKWAYLSVRASQGSHLSLIFVYPTLLARAVSWLFCALIVLLNASGPDIVLCTRTSETGAKPTRLVQAFM